MNWINVKDELPEYYKEVLVAYSDEDGSNKGIMIASLQPKLVHTLQENCYYWLEGDNIKGEFYSQEDSIITHWFDYQEYLNYPE